MPTGAADAASDAADRDGRDGLGPDGIWTDGGIVDLRAVGERIEVLLEGSSVHGALARQRTEELLRLVTDLYGAGLERLLEILYDAGRLDPDVLADLADDELVASLLLVHGLHPDDLRTRVDRVLGSVRPSLSAQGVGIELVSIGADDVVELRLTGAVGGCAVDSLTRIVEQAIETAAPDVAALRIVVAASRGSSVIPVASLRSRLGQVAP
jgi:Fe-S cluster biogenesis protein NfuA